MARAARRDESMPLGRVTIRREGKRSLTSIDGGSTIVEQSRYTWRPAASIKADLPKNFQLVMTCQTGPDGMRRFAPAVETELFLIEAAIGGLAILARTRSLDAQGRSSYDAMRLIFQHAPLLQEHLGRSFKRKSDLLIPVITRTDPRDRDILPERIGLVGDGDGVRWTVSKLLQQGRDYAMRAGDTTPDPSRCIACGLYVAARQDPLDPTAWKTEEARGLVRMALFAAGPAAGIDEVAKQAVTERLLVAMEHHGEDDTKAFNRWFFQRRDGLIHQIAKQKKQGGPISGEVVRQALLELVVDSYTYAADCVCIQMQAFLQALPRPPNREERGWFTTLYLNQTYLGGLPLILLRDPFPFLKEAVLEILAAPEELGPVAVLLRMLQYYEEMATRRREVDRNYKKRSLHRDGEGRVARTLPLVGEPPEPGVDSTRNVFQEIAMRLIEGRNAVCTCGPGATIWSSLVEREDTDDVIVIGFGCSRCGHTKQMMVARQEFEQIGQQVLEAKSDRYG